MSRIEEIAKNITSFEPAKKDDIAGYGPFQCRASGDGWFYRSSTRGPETCFFDKKDGDLELEVLKARIRRNKTTIQESLSKSGFNQESVRDKIKDKLRNKNLTTHNGRTSWMNLG